MVWQPNDYLQAMGHRPVLTAIPANWCSGPFFLDASIANGGLTAVDLTTQDAWYADAAVRAAYNPTNGSSTQMQISVHIESVALAIVDGTFATLAPTTKQKLWDTGYVSLYAKIGGGTFGMPLDNSYKELIEVQNRIEAAAAASTGTTIQGRPFVLPSPFQVDCQQDTLQLQSVADCALGAATKCKVVVWGAVFPRNVTDYSLSSAPGVSASCGASSAPAATSGPKASQATAVRSVNVGVRSSTYL